MKRRYFIITTLAIIVVAAIITAATRFPAASPSVVGQHDEEKKSTDDGTPVRASRVNPDGTLDETKQEYIWQAEHVTFEIETYVGKPLSAALMRRDISRTAALLTQDFSGFALELDASETVEHSFAKEQLWTRHRTEEKLNAEQFAEYLVSRLKDFDQIQKVGMRVLRIDAKQEPAKQEVAKEEDGDNADNDNADRNNADVDNVSSWEIQTLITCLGVSETGERLSFSQHGNATVTFKSDEEIRNEAVLARWAVDDESLVTCAVLMQEATAEFGLDKLPLHDNWQHPDSVGRQYPHQVAVGDYDKDGFPDIAVSDTDGQFFLLRNLHDGGTEDVTDDVRLPRKLIVKNMQTVVTWIDFDNNGFPDILIGDKLFRNQNGKRFEWVRGTGLDLKKDPMGTAVADYDCDGLPDLYILYQEGKEESDSLKLGWINDAESGAENQLWRNKGDGTFEDVTQRTGTGGGQRLSFAAVWFHANDDRYPDLYVANDFGTNSLLINSADGTFTDRSEESQTADFATSMGVAAGDINGDGRTDVYVANMYSKMGRRIVDQVCEEDYPPGIYKNLQGSCAGNRLYTNQGDGQPFEEVSQSLGINGVGWAHSPAFADFDRDGFLDIYATAGFISYRRDKPDG